MLDTWNGTTADATIDETTKKPTPSTLDELVERARASLAARVKEREEEQTRIAEEHVATLRERIQRAVSADAWQVLGMTIERSDEESTQAHARFTVDGQTWWLRPRDGFPDYGDTWVIYSPDIEYEQVKHSALEEGIFLAIGKWRERQASQQSDEIAEDSDGKMAKASRPTPEPRLIQGQDGPYSGYRLYELSASSGCGALNQYVQHLARIGADGEVELAWLTGYPQHDARGELKKPETYRIAAETMPTLVALWTTYMAEVAEQKAKTADTTATSETGDTSEADPPF